MHFLYVCSNFQQSISADIHFLFHYSTLIKYNDLNILRVYTVQRNNTLAKRILIIVEKPFNISITVAYAPTTQSTKEEFLKFTLHKITSRPNANRKNLQSTLDT